MLIYVKGYIKHEGSGVTCEAVDGSIKCCAPRKNSQALNLSPWRDFARQEKGKQSAAAMENCHKLESYRSYLHTLVKSAQILPHHLAPVPSAMSLPGE